jgi:hypothetical protein
MENAMTLLLSDESSTNQYELSRPATSFTYRDGMFDGAVEKTWHLAAIGNKQSSDARNETHSKFAYSKNNEKHERIDKNERGVRYQTYHTLKTTYPVGQSRNTCTKSPGRKPVQRTGRRAEYSVQRNDSVRRGLFGYTYSAGRFGRRDRDHLNQNSEGNSDTSESEIGAPALDTLLSYQAVDHSPQTNFTFVQSRGDYERSDSGIVDSFTANAYANQNKKQVSNKTPTCKVLDKNKSPSGVIRETVSRKLFEKIRHLPSRPVGIVKAGRVENRTDVTQGRSTNDGNSGQATITKKKRKRLRKIYVNGLWIPVRSQKDIQRLFSTEPVVVLERIPSSILRRLTAHGRQRVGSAMSLLDASETGGEMGEDIDELKQNIAEDNNLEGCEFAMDLTNYSLGAPDKLFEVDPSISFNIDKFRKACEAFRSRQTNTGPDPVLSGYRSDEEERLHSEEPEYVYFDEPTDGDEVFHDSYNFNAFSEKTKYLDLQDTSPNGETVSSENCNDGENSLHAANMDKVGNEENAGDSKKNLSNNSLETNSILDNANEPKRANLNDADYQDSGLLSGREVVERLTNVYYRNRDSTDPGEPYSPEYIEHALQKSPTSPLIDDGNVGKDCQGDMPQSPSNIGVIDDSSPFKPVSHIREDVSASPAQTEATASNDPTSSSPRVVSATPVTAAGETVIIEEISSPQNAVFVSDRTVLSKMESDSLISLNIDEEKVVETERPGSAFVAREKSALDTENVTNISDPSLHTETIVPNTRREHSPEENTKCDDNRRDEVKDDGLKNKEVIPCAILCDDFEMDIERDEPYPISMVVVNMQEMQGGDVIEGSGSLNDPVREQTKAEQFDKVYDLSTTVYEKHRFIMDGSMHEAASSSTGSTSGVFEESFPYGFQFAPSGTSPSGPNHLISSAELVAIEQMTNGNMSDDEVFPRLVIAEENSNIGSSTNESTPNLVIENVISLKNVAETYFNHDYQLDFNIDVSVSDNNGETETNQIRQDSLSQLNDDNQILEIAESSVNVSEALDMTSTSGQNTNHAPRDSSPESSKSDGTLKCVLTKKIDGDAQVRYVIKSLSSVDSDDPAPFFTLSRKQRGDPTEPHSSDGGSSPNIQPENKKKQMNTHDTDVGYVTREQAIRTCAALADITTVDKTSETAPVSPAVEESIENHRNLERFVRKSHKKSKKKIGHDLKRSVVKNRSNLGVGQNQFIKRPLLRKKRISSSLKQFNTRSKSHTLILNVSSQPEQGPIHSQHASKKTDKVNSKRIWPLPKREVASDVSSDLSDIGELVEQAILDGRPTKKRKRRSKKQKSRNKLAAKNGKDKKALEDLNRDTSTGMYDSHNVEGSQLRAEHDNLCGK